MTAVRVGAGSVGAPDAFEVTVRDLETGDVETCRIPLHTYLLIPTGDCHVSAMLVWGNGTQQITVKGCHPGKDGAGA